MKQELLYRINKAKGASLQKEIVTINDLREKEFSGKQLSEQEMVALCNFDRLRIEELNKQKFDQDFHKCFIKFRTLAHFSSFTDFL